LFGISKRVQDAYEQLSAWESAVDASRNTETTRQGEQAPGPEQEHD
jgi:hypothetical protein